MEKFKIINNESTKKSELKSFRIKSELFSKIEELSKKYDISMNKLVNQCIEYALNNIEIDNEQYDKK